jgi:hypothetical protein
MKQLLFFATKSDLETLLATLEDRVSVKYVPCGDSGGPGAVIYERGSDLPRLGHATSESAGRLTVSASASREFDLVRGEKAQR